jgi:FKBP-type peptidyl-prolyl cis-trans isomerase
MPANFVVNRLIPGWTEALTLMREGDHWQLVIPTGLAYGTRGAGGGVIPPNQTLVFDLELVKVTPAPKDQQQDQDQPSQ